MSCRELFATLAYNRRRMSSARAPHPTPVFVLGVQRSGTTWLANILAQHSRAVAVQSADHYGIHESIFFSHFARAYGDLNNEADFRRFAADFTSSDYYVLSGLEPEWLSEIRPRSYPAAFRAMMDEFARRAGADLWVEKSPAHTLLAEQLAADFPDARFVAVLRETRAIVASQLWLPGRRPPAYPARLRRLIGLSLHCAQQRWLRRFCKRNDACFLTTYERLARDTEGETRRICAFLGIDYEATMLELPWRRNTSFGAAERRRRALQLPDRLVVAVANAALHLLPASVVGSLIARRRARRGVIWPDWCWRRRDAGLLERASTAGSAMLGQESSPTK